MLNIGCGSSGVGSGCHRGHKLPGTLLWGTQMTFPTHAPVGSSVSLEMQMETVAKC